MKLAKCQDSAPEIVDRKDSSVVPNIGRFTIHFLGPPSPTGEIQPPELGILGVSVGKLGLHSTTDRFVDL